MKSGTSSLYRYLVGSKLVYDAGIKEPNILLEQSFPKRERGYRKLFASCPRKLRRIDASTSYSMIPRFDGIAQRAKLHASPNCWIIYIVRDPIERLKSQYTHGVLSGFYKGSFESVLQSNENLLNFSDYERQILPWCQVFGENRVIVVSFEYMTSNPKAALEKIANLLCLDSFSFPEVAVHANKSSKRPTWPSGLRKLRYKLCPRGVALRDSSIGWLIVIAEKIMKRQKTIPNVSHSIESESVIQEELSRASDFAKKITVTTMDCQEHL